MFVNLVLPQRSHPRDSQPKTSLSSLLNVRFQQVRMLLLHVQDADFLGSTKSIRDANKQQIGKGLNESSGVVLELNA